MRNRSFLWFAAVLIYGFLYIPLAVVVLFSFNDSELNAGWVGFTTHWYRDLWQDQDMLAAAGNSLVIAFLSAFIATVLGTMAGIAMHRYRLRLLSILVLAPVAMPELLLGVALLLMFRQVLDLTLGFWSILLSHITFSIGAAAIIVQSQLEGIEASVFEAARDLGANPWQTYFSVTLPLLSPALVAGFLIAFTLSIDDFVITFFNAGVGVKTLPLQIYSMIKVAVTPEVNVVSSMLMLLTVSLITIASRLLPSSLQTHAPVLNKV
jgi:spermidine/putrescine transport system permease protein